LPPIGPLVYRVVDFPGRVDCVLQRSFKLHGHVDGEPGHCVTPANVPVSFDIIGLQIEY
jgi:hypothetical protein